jgi:hypothetical protein
MDSASSSSRRVMQGSQDRRSSGPPIRALKPAVDMLGPLPYTGLQSMFDPLFPKGIYSYAKSDYFDAIPPATVDDMIAWAERKPTPMSLTHLNHWGRVANG